MECYVSTILFDNDSEVIHDRVRLSEIRPMTEDDYYVRGCTALIDAIGDAVKHIGNIHKYARPEDVPAHTMFVITTDGMENASHKYSSDEVKKMIETKKEKNGWEFLFIGANIDSVETARRFGIARERAVDYHADKKGTEVLYKAVSGAVCSIRRNKDLDASWSDEIAEDYSSRDSGKRGHKR